MLSSLPKADHVTFQEGSVVHSSHEEAHSQMFFHVKSVDLLSELQILIVYLLYWLVDWIMINKQKCGWRQEHIQKTTFITINFKRLQLYSNPKPLSS